MRGSNDFGWDLPPGVSLNDIDPQTTKYCPKCGEELDEEGHCGDCDWQESIDERDRVEIDD